MAGHRLGSGSGVAGASLPHESAELHVSGEATYTDDIPEIQGTLHCALGMSQKAHARITAMDLDAVRRAPGVVAVLTAADIPGENNRSEEHTSELQSLMRNSYAVFCLKKKNNTPTTPLT